MAFSPSQRMEFTKRNVAFGQAGASKRRAELAGYAESLQRLQDQGLLNLQNDRQAFELPGQIASIRAMEAGTEGSKLGNISQRFYQGLAEQYGPRAIMQSLGILPKMAKSSPELKLPGLYEPIQPPDIAQHDLDLRPTSDTSTARPSSRFQIGPVPWAANLRKRSREKERVAAPFSTRY